MKWTWALLMAACTPRLAGNGQVVAGRVVLQGANDFSGALVSLDDGAPQRTASFGDFSFAGVLPGTHIVTARCDCDTLEARVAAPVVVSAAAISDVALVLTPVGRVVGQVTDTSGAALAGARIFAAGTAAVAYAQAGGSYVLERVPIGVHSLVASQAGYVTQIFSDVPIASGPDIATNFVLAIDTSPDPNAPDQAPVIDSFTFTPAPNDGRNPQPIPVASLESPDVVHSGAPIALTVVAHDPAGGALMYLWSADEGQLIGSGTPAVQWVPSDEGGEVVVVVVDPQGAAATARHTFHAPPKSIRGATLYGDEVIYSEGRADSSGTDSRDVVGFDLDARTERTLAGGAGEQNSPRVVGDILAFGDQVFTLVEPTVFHLHLLGLGSNTLDASFGRDLAPDDSIAIDFRVDTPLTAGAITYQSFDDSLAPFGIGTLAVATQSFSSFDDWQTGSATPNYPCFVSLGSHALGVVGNTLLAYTQGQPSALAATLPADDCVDMQADGAWVAIQQTSPGAALTLANWQTGEVRIIGTEVDSYALHGTQLAYADMRTGFSGVYLYDVAQDTNAVVPTPGPQIRRVLELSDTWLVYGELAQTGGMSSYSSTSLWAYRLP